jgi:fucose 4-O-acetylase-like acetyltransferase
MRGLGITLVVLGHSLFGDSWGVKLVAVTVFAFHMPLLIAVSGMAAWFSAPSGRIRMSRRAWGLLVPYAVWLIVPLTILNADPLRFLRVRIVPVVVAAALNPRAEGGAWFLYVLFILSLVLWTLSWVPGNTRRWVFAAAVLALFAPHFGGIEPWSAQQVSHIVPSSLGSLDQAAGLLGWRNVLWFLPFFLGGFLMGPAHKRLEQSGMKELFVGAVLLALGVALVWPLAKGGIAAEWWWLRPLLASTGRAGLPDYLYVLSRYAAAAFGIVFAAGVCGLARGSFRWALASLGRISLGIYLTHTYFVPWVTGAGLLTTLVRFAVVMTMGVLLAVLFNQSNLTAFLLVGRLPKAWSDLLVGVTLVRVVLWLAFTVACVLLFLRPSWKAHAALAVMLAGALLFLSWRRSLRDSASAATA